MPTLNLVEEHCLYEDYDSLGRHYTTPTGHRFPSVTTVLGQMPKKGLDDWRERVGEEKADRIMKASARVGSEYHDACENYIRGNDVGGLTIQANRLFGQVKPVLKRDIGEVRGIELPMWSTALRTAGRTDLIAEYKGELSIIDYKNSRSEKPKHFCTNYFLQGAAYARMFYELYGISIKQIVIIIAQWGRPKPTIHVERVKDWAKPVVETFKTYNPAFKE